MAKVKNSINRIPEAYVVPAEQISQEILRIIGGTKVLMFSIVIITLIVSGLGLMNTVLMSTFERQLEFGYFRCVGATRFDIFKLILIETLILGTIGIIIGFVAGYILSAQLDSWIRDFLPYVPAGTLLRPNLLIVFYTTTIVYAIGILSSFYPGYKASRVSPMEAVRNA